MAKKYTSYAAFEKDFNKNTKKIIIELGKTIPEVGEIIEDDIKNRTRLGYGVSKNESAKQKLAKLSDSYKIQRKRDSKRGQLSKDTKPSKSNLTKSGSMLDNLETTSNKRKLSLKVKPSGTDSDGVSNAKKAQWVSKDRPFLFLSKTEIKRITKFLRKELDIIVAKLF